MLYELFVTFGVIKHIDLPLDHKQAVDPEKLENPKE
jgi:hypothetical protein